jgi:hypothetical protein
VPGVPAQPWFTTPLTVISIELLTVVGVPLKIISIQLPVLEYRVKFVPKTAGANPEFIATVVLAEFMIRFAPSCSEILPNGLIFARFYVLTVAVNL